jgi:hypothetical protein
MAKFLVTYHGAAMPNDPEVMAAARAAFGQWLSEAGSAVVDPGEPLTMVAQVADGNPSPAVALGGYSIVEAPSVDAVVALLKGHPFVARGGTLQVNQAMAI